MTPLLPLLRTAATLTSAIAAVVLLVTAVSLWVECRPPSSYLVLIDAGSVHTSIYTYRLAGGGAGEGGIAEVASCELGQIGVSSFASDPQGAAQFLANHRCLREAVEQVPLASRSTSSVLLGGTAGLRVLRLASPHLAHQILGNLTAALSERSGGMAATARILDGTLEGRDGWVTANYLSGGLEGGQPRGALDWGGASSQVTVVAEEGEEDSRVEVAGTEYPLMARSHLCYGQAEALARHRAGLVFGAYLAANRSLGAPIALEDPCLPAKASLALPLAALLASPCTNYTDAAFIRAVRQLEHETVTLYRASSSSPSSPSCSSTVAAAFQPSLCSSTYAQAEAEVTCLDPSSIPPPTNATYLAFSTYWYLTRGMGLGHPSSPYTVHLPTFDSALASLCSSDLATLQLARARGGWGLAQAKVAHDACFQATFMRALLTTAYHFHSWGNITFVKRLGEPPAEVGWSLGHAIASAGQVEAGPGGCISLPVFLALLLASLLAALCAVCAHYTRRQNSAAAAPYEALA